MTFARADQRPGAITAVHLAVGLQVALLIGATIIGAVFSSFFDLFRNAWYWHIPPAFGGYVLGPALAGVVLLLIPLCLVLYRFWFGRPALIVGEVAVCVPAVAFAAHVAHVEAGSILVGFVVAFVGLAVLTIAMLLRKVTSRWLARSVR